MEQKMTPAEEVEILRACCCVAGADGDIGERELEILQQLAKNIGVGQASLQAMIERGKSDPEFHKKQFSILKSEPTRAMAILIQVATGDEDINEREAAVIYNLASNLGVEASIVEQLLHAAKNQS